MRKSPKELFDKIGESQQQNVKMLRKMSLFIMNFFFPALTFALLCYRGSDGR